MLKHAAKPGRGSSLQCANPLLFGFAKWVRCPLQPSLTFHDSRIGCSSLRLREQQAPAPSSPPRDAARVVPPSTLVHHTLKDFKTLTFTAAAPLPAQPPAVALCAGCADRCKRCGKTLAAIARSKFDSGSSSAPRRKCLQGPPAVALSAPLFKLKNCERSKAEGRWLAPWEAQPSEPPP